MAISKKRLETIGKKLSGRVHISLLQKKINRFLELSTKGLIETKDGRVVTHAEWADSKPEPLRSKLLSLINDESTDLSE